MRHLPDRKSKGLRIFVVGAGRWVGLRPTASCACRVAQGCHKGDVSVCGDTWPIAKWRLLGRRSRNLTLVNLACSDFSLPETQKARQSACPLGVPKNWLVHVPDFLDSKCGTLSVNCVYKRDITRVADKVFSHSVHRIGKAQFARWISECKCATPS